MTPSIKQLIQTLKQRRHAEAESDIQSATTHAEALGSSAPCLYSQIAVVSTDNSPWTVSDGTATSPTSISHDSPSHLASVSHPSLSHTSVPDTCHIDSSVPHTSALLSSVSHSKPLVLDKESDARSRVCSSSSSSSPRPESAVGVSGKEAVSSANDSLCVRELEQTDRPEVTGSPTTITTTSKKLRCPCALCTCDQDIPPRSSDGAAVATCCSPPSSAPLRPVSHNPPAVATSNTLHVPPPRYHHAKTSVRCRTKAETSSSHTAPHDLPSVAFPHTAQTRGVCSVEKGETFDRAQHFLEAPVGNIFFVANWVSEATEAIILDAIDQHESGRNVKLRGRSTQVWGGKVTQYGLDDEEQLPHWIYCLCCCRLVEEGVFKRDECPNHALINTYEYAQGILPHQDGPAYAPTVATVSLGASCVMDFYNPPSRYSTNGSSHIAFSVFLPPRSLLVFQDEAYTDLLHGIQSRIEDDLSDRFIINSGCHSNRGISSPRASFSRESLLHLDTTSSLKRDPDSDTLETSVSEDAWLCPRGFRTSLTLRHVPPFARRRSCVSFSST